MNGAETPLRTLLNNGVDVCFANPGTSEIQFVAALDRHPAMRGVLCLFEGVATGAAGAAIACPERPVVCLQVDGSALYTISGLWTQAREKLNVTTVLLNNRAYAILRDELERVGGSQVGPAASDLLDLGRPEIDFTAVATGMGVPATRATSTTELAEQFITALATPGPHLIEAVLQPS